MISHDCRFAMLVLESENFPLLLYAVVTCSQRRHRGFQVSQQDASRECAVVASRGFSAKYVELLDT